MNSHLIQNIEALEELTDEDLRSVVTRNNEQRKKGKVLVKQKGNQQITRTIDPALETNYPYTYHASQHERQWLLASIEEFHEQNWFEDVLAMVKGGKEATVYLCSAPEGMEQRLLAAKVYRPRRFRNLKKDHLYREGREQLDATGKVILDDRSHHAMQKKSSYGLELLHTSWIGHEVRTMEVLHAAGVDLPRVYASSDNAIMMDYIGDESSAAPTLNSVNLTTTEARPLFERVMHNIELMLRNNRVHADLSAYNILYWNGKITLIDFPQAIHPDENPNAWRIFARDVARVCDYFATQGVKSDPHALAARMWKSKGRALNPQIDPLFLDPDKEEDRQAWQRQT